MDETNVDIDEVIEIEESVISTEESAPIAE